MANKVRPFVAAVAAALVAGPLFAARPVARWDVVPYQRVTDVFKVGVVAFHESGVKVVFKVGGRKKWMAKRATKNERTGVEEFVFPFNPKGLKSGPVTLGATAVSDGGEEYELPDLVLYADPKSELGSRAEVWADIANGDDYADGGKGSPVRTLGAAIKRAGDGGTVYLKKGKYVLHRIGIGKKRQYWTHVTAAPGTDGKDVILEGGRPATDKLAFRDVDVCIGVKSGENLAVYVGEGKIPVHAWFDNCRIYNRNGRSSGRSVPFGNGLVAFVTGGTTRDITHGPRCPLIRNHSVETVARGAFSCGSTLIVNCKVRDIDPEGSDIVAPIFYEGYERPPKWVSDTILFNVEATECRSRGLVGSRLRDSAFVNVSFSAAGRDDSSFTRFSLGLENVLFRKVSIGNQDWMWVEKEYGLVDPRPRDVVLDGVKVERFVGFDVSGLDGIRRK